MRLLLDAHALLWWLGAEEQLSEAAYGAIVTRDPALAVYGVPAIW